MEVTEKQRTFLAVQQLRLSSSTAGDVGLIPGQRAKIPHAMGKGKKKKKKKKERKAEEKFLTQYSLK